MRGVLTTGKNSWKIPVPVGSRAHLADMGASKWIHLLPVSEFCETRPVGAIFHVFHVNARERYAKHETWHVGRGLHNCSTDNEL